MAPHAGAKHHEENQMKCIYINWLGVFFRYLIRGSLLLLATNRGISLHQRTQYFGSRLGERNRLPEVSASSGANGESNG